MKSFRVDDEVTIPCDIGPGAFPGENLVTFDTVSGPISGFVSDDIVMKTEGDTAYIRAIVKDINVDTITIWIQGSFFTTTGLAYLAADWAKSELRLIN